jgi:hypothetical protein
MPSMLNYGRYREEDEEDTEFVFSYPVLHSLPG